MDTDNIVLDEESILNNIKSMYNGNWDDILDYYKKVIKCNIFDFYSVCDKAAYHGHLKVLKYAHDNGCPWESWTCATAARNGHLEVLKYAHENGCPLDKWTCAYAAENGHLEVLKYAHDNGCPWDSWTCATAARNGHLEVLKYAHENGCPLDKWTCAYAAENGHLEVLYYLYENEAPFLLTSLCIHPNCKEFFDTVGEYWKKGDFTFNHTHLKPAKN